MELEIWQIVGMEEAKETLYRDLDIRAYHLTEEPRGVLLAGASGTGKTTLVEAMLRHYELAFPDTFHIIRITTGDVSGHVTTTAEKIKTLFNRIRIITKEKIVIMFMDEMEELCMSRAGRKSGHIKNEQTSNFLREINPSLHNFYLIGTTNRPKMIDSAMFNPTRIAERIDIFPMNREERRHLIDFYLPNLIDRTKNILLEYSKGDEDNLSKIDKDNPYRPWLTWNGSDFFNLSQNLEAIRLQQSISNPTYQTTDEDIFHEFTKINNRKIHTMMKDDYILNPD